MAALGGGSIASCGGGIALGTLVLNVTSLGVGALVEGIAMAYAGSVAKKHANRAKDEMHKNEQIINDAISMQFEICKSATEMKHVAVNLCNKVYKPLVLRMKALVEKKSDWNLFTDEEKLLVENTVLVVQILHFLNNTPLYKVTKTNSDGEVEEVVANSDEVKSALENAKDEASRLEEA